MRKALYFGLLILTTTEATALGRDATCANCNIHGAVASTAILAEPSFPADICEGSVNKTQDGDGITTYQTYVASLTSGENLFCPLNVEVDGAQSNILDAQNADLEFNGVTTGQLELIANNGSLTVRNGGSRLKASSVNGDVSISDSSGIFDLYTKNGDIVLTNVTSSSLGASTENGSIEVTSLTIYSKKTVMLTAKNGEVTVRTLRAAVQGKKPASSSKVRIIASSARGTVKDRRSKSARTMTAAQRMKAPKLIIRAKGNVTIR